ncbi:hypothetical protein Cob_v000320 [Colletotrichum orbiculare MAFF 240422]|uniref:Uncharacterized protein n=1 Tax=Colletotrichum orbiculare (strain 104-T / ATCC 96160 / CBS 514.97 / LARS 414 / MAFF 240422) TaxID=1213857 RepID=A0A484G8C8_COLOR|nr:hypothetical protein Cob_v000320 [Colletotrichum orbiculare MAFF 240422]
MIDRPTNRLERRGSGGSPNLGIGSLAPVVIAIVRSAKRRQPIPTLETKSRASSIKNLDNMLPHPPEQS